MASKGTVSISFRIEDGTNMMDVREADIQSIKDPCTVQQKLGGNR